MFFPVRFDASLPWRVQGLMSHAVCGPGSLVPGERRISSRTSTVGFAFFLDGILFFCTVDFLQPSRLYPDCSHVFNHLQEQARIRL